MKERNLKSMPYARARVIETDEGVKILKSYDTYVAFVYPDGFIRCTGLYSVTTMKHLSVFARECGLCYNDFKLAFKSEALYNPITGEISLV